MTVASGPGSWEAVTRAGLAGDRLWLWGFMGAGKTTVGRLVAQELGWAFVDTDERVAELSQRSVADLWAAEGEAAFRGLEARVVRELAETPGPRVVSLGGGALLMPETRGRVASESLIVLDVSLAECQRRLERAVERRPLHGGLATLWAERREHYLGLGRSVATDGRAPRAVAAAVVAWVRGSEGAA